MTQAFATYVLEFDLGQALDLEKTGKPDPLFEGKNGAEFALGSNQLLQSVCNFFPELGIFHNRLYKERFSGC